MMRREEGGTGRWTEIGTRRMDMTEGIVTEMYLGSNPNPKGMSREMSGDQKVRERSQTGKICQLIYWMMKPGR